MCILDGLLEQQTSLRLLAIMTDTAGVSAGVCGLVWLLGSQFRPRLAASGAARFGRLAATADYGVLHTMARHWDDFLRVAGSLQQGTVRASELMRSLLQSKRPSALARASGALGRMPRTLYMLPSIEDEPSRRRMLTQLNRGEARHSVARAVLHGQRGERRQRYREGQEDPRGALGLVVHAIVWWHTLSMEAALQQLHQGGRDVAAADVARLSPLVHRPINFQGRYAFALAEAVAQGALRPLRAPHDEEELISLPSFPFRCYSQAMIPPGAWAAASVSWPLVLILRDGGCGIRLTGKPAGVHSLHMVCNGLGFLPLGAGIRLGLLLGQLTRMHYEKAQFLLRHPPIAVLHFHGPDDALPMPTAARFVLGPPRLFH